MNATSVRRPPSLAGALALAGCGYSPGRVRFPAVLSGLVLAPFWALFTGIGPGAGAAIGGGVGAVAGAAISPHDLNLGKPLVGN